VKRASLALLTAFVVGSALGESPEPTKVRMTTWNLEWFPNGSAHDATPEVQAQRIAAAADVLRPIDPDIVLLQEVRDYDVCARLGEAIAPGTYHVAICSAFKEPFQSGLGKQQVAILSKYQAQAAWAEGRTRRTSKNSHGAARACAEHGAAEASPDAWIRNL
jgi:hypothetical protein